MSDTPPVITESQLRAWLMDPDVPDDRIAPYLTTAPREGGSFDPVVIPNPALVTPSAEEAAVLMSSVNRIARWRRAQAYNRKIRGWTGPRLVSEGDSWFQYPILLKDVIDHLDAHYAVRSLGAAGDLISDMAAQDELVAAIAAESPDAVVLSGGGNDLLGDGRLAKALHPFDPSLAPDGYLTPEFEATLRDVIGLYRDILHRVVRTFPGLPVFIHGYDHAIPARGKWLGRPMEKLGILDGALQQALVARIVDRFYDALKDTLRAPSLSRQVELVDCRNLVEGDWHDELHPDNSGYARVAARFHDRISARLSTEALESGGPMMPGTGLSRAAGAATAFAATASDADLIAELGRRATMASADPEHPVPLEADFRGAALEGMGDVFHAVGKRILKRVNRQLHGLVCGDDADNTADREKLKNVLGLDDTAVASVLVQILVGSFGLLPAVATVVAALFLKHVLRPSLEEVCEVWGDGLGE
jgi:lysophospholipase L1-like esterase